ncbi:MAG: hypothetical protein ACK6AD_13450 [Cyanobacteriota bacterium]
MPIDPTDALVEALMPIVFGSEPLEPLEPLEHRHLRLVTPSPSCVSAKLLRRIHHRPPAVL